MIDTIHLIIQLKVICDDASSNPKIGNIERGPFKKAQHKCYLRNKCSKFRHQIYQIFCRKKKKAYLKLFYDCKYGLDYFEMCAGKSRFYTKSFRIYL